MQWLVARSYLLKPLQPPNTVPPAGDHLRGGGGISHSNPDIYVSYA